MDLLPEDCTGRWGHFFCNFQASARLSVSEALHLLRRVLGKDRPVLLLIDDPLSGEEPFGAGTGKQLLTQVLAARDANSCTNAVVATSNVRPIVQMLSKHVTPVFTVAPPLSCTVTFGAEETELWAREMLKRTCPKEVPSDYHARWWWNETFAPHNRELVVQRLKAAPLLASGSPSLITKFLTKLADDPTCMDSVLNFYHSDKPLILMHRLLDQMTFMAPSVPLTPSMCDLVLSAQPVDLLSNKEAERLVEKGALQVARAADTPGHFYLSAPLHVPFRAAVHICMQEAYRTSGVIGGLCRSPDTRSAQTRTLDTLPPYFNEAASSGDYMWSGAVILNVMSKSLAPNATVANMFCVSLPRLQDMRVTRPMVMETNTVAKHKGVKRKNFNRSMMVTDPLAFPSLGVHRFAHVTSVDGQDAWMYMSTALNASVAVNTLARCVVHAMDIHFRSFPKSTMENIQRVQKAMNTIHPVLYQWGDHVSFDKETLLKEVAKKVDFDAGFGDFQHQRYTIPAEQLKKLAVLFLQEHFDNVQLVGQAQLEKWLLPTWLTLPQYLSTAKY